MKIPQRIIYIPLLMMPLITQVNGQSTWLIAYSTEQNFLIHTVPSTDPEVGDKGRFTVDENRDLKLPYENFLSSVHGMDLKSYTFEQFRGSKFEFNQRVAEIKRENNISDKSPGVSYLTLVGLKGGQRGNEDVYFFWEFLKKIRDQGYDDITYDEHAVIFSGFSSFYFNGQYKGQNHGVILLRLNNVTKSNYNNCINHYKIWTQYKQNLEHIFLEKRILNTRSYAWQIFKDEQQETRSQIGPNDRVGWMEYNCDCENLRLLPGSKTSDPYENSSYASWERRKKNSIVPLFEDKRYYIAPGISFTNFGEDLITKFNTWSLEFGHYYARDIVGFSLEIGYGKNDNDLELPEDKLTSRDPYLPIPSQYDNGGFSQELNEEFDNGSTYSYYFILPKANFYLGIIILDMGLGIDVNRRIVPVDIVSNSGGFSGQTVSQVQGYKDYIGFLTHAGIRWNFAVCTPGVGANFSLSEGEFLYFSLSLAIILGPNLYK